MAGQALLHEMCSFLDIIMSSRTDPIFKCLFLDCEDLIKLYEEIASHVGFGARLIRALVFDLHGNKSLTQQRSR